MRCVCGERLNFNSIVDYAISVILNDPNTAEVYTYTGMLSAKLVSKICEEYGMFTFIFSLCIDNKEKLEKLKTSFKHYSEYMRQGLANDIELALTKITVRIGYNNKVMTELEERGKGCGAVIKSPATTIRNTFYRNKKRINTEFANLYLKTVQINCADYIKIFANFIYKNNGRKRGVDLSQFFYSKVLMALCNAEMSINEKVVYLFPILVDKIACEIPVLAEWIGEFSDASFPDIGKRTELLLGAANYMRISSYPTVLEEILTKFLDSPELNGRRILGVLTAVFDLPNFSSNSAAIETDSNSSGTSEADDTDSQAISGVNAIHNPYISEQNIGISAGSTGKNSVSANIRHIVSKIIVKCTDYRFDFEDYVTFNHLLSNYPEQNEPLNKILSKILDPPPRENRRTELFNFIIARVEGIKASKKYESVGGLLQLFRAKPNYNKSYELFVQIQSICRNDIDMMALMYTDIVKYRLLFTTIGHAVFLEQHPDSAIFVAYLHSQIMCLVHYFVDLKHGGNERLVAKRVHCSRNFTIEEKEKIVDDLIKRYVDSVKSFENELSKSAFEICKGDPETSLIYGFTCYYNCFLKSHFRTDRQDLLLSLPDLTLDSCALLFNQLCGNAVATAISDYRRDLIEVIACVFEYFMTEDFTIPFRPRLLDFMIQRLITVHKDPEYVYKRYLKHEECYFNFMIKPTFDYYLELERQAMAKNGEIRIADYDMRRCASDIFSYYASQASHMPILLDDIIWHIKSILRKLISHGYNGAAHEADFATRIYPVLRKMMLERGVECYGMEDACPEGRFFVFVELLKGAVDIRLVWSIS